VATGLKANNAIVQDGASWEDVFQIDAGALTNLDRSNFFVRIMGNDQYQWAECLYIGSGAITIAELENLPLGSSIICSGIATAAIYVHTAADTWKLQAINT